MHTKKTFKYSVLIAAFAAISILAACSPGAASPATGIPNTAIPATQAPVNTDTVVPTETTLPTQEPTATTAATQAPTDTSEAVTTGTVSFVGQILPILNDSCFNCHGGNRTEEGLVLSSHDTVMAGSEEGAVIVPGDPDASVLVELVATQKMPKRGAKLTLEQVQLISDWVAQGALNN